MFLALTLTLALTGPAAPPALTIKARPVASYGSVVRVQLPEGEFFDRFHVIDSPRPQDRYTFSTKPAPAEGAGWGAVHTLRDGNGQPVLVVVNPRR